MKILVLGDSRSAPSADCWPNYLQAEIQAISGTYFQGVTNYAVGGDWSYNQMLKLQNSGVPVGVTDVLVDLGTNDVQNGANLETQVRPNFTTIIGLCRAANAEVHIAIPYLFYDRLTGDPNAGDPQNYEKGAPLRAMLMKLCGAMNVRCLNLMSALGPVIYARDTDPSVPHVLVDNIHPHTDIKPMIARLWARHLVDRD